MALFSTAFLSFLLPPSSSSFRTWGHYSNDPIIFVPSPSIAWCCRRLWERKKEENENENEDEKEEEDNQ